MTESDITGEAALKRSKKLAEPLDPATGKGMLKELKQIFDQAGVAFFLRHGTCLGAIRDNAFIPWDDDLDVGCVIGLHGFTEQSIEPVIATFRDNGFFVKVEYLDQSVFVSMMKSSVRIEWVCYRTIDGGIFQYPGICIPVGLFTDLKEIEFMGVKLHVPNPPEEYLRVKYGEDWTVPKQIGFEKDVVEMIPEIPAAGRAGRLKQLLSNTFLPWRAGRLKVLDQNDEPVAGAEVVLVGLGRSRTNRQGYARFYLPCDDDYALVVRFAGHEEVLYEEKLRPGETYVYRQDVQSTSGRYLVLTLESTTRTTETA